MDLEDVELPLAKRGTLGGEKSTPMKLPQMRERSLDS
jgi:hypothetical protein